ncbi:protein downstream neighbor of son homolog [Aplochiton taeniatus]
MSQQAGYSPSFKRPAEILRMRRKRARSEGVSSNSQGSISCPALGTSSPAGVRPFSPGPLFSAPTRPGGGVKRRNPFANIENTYSPKKRLAIYTDRDTDTLDNVKPVEPESVSVEGEKSTKKCSASEGGLHFSERLIEAEKQNQELSSKKRLSFTEDDSLFEEEEENLAVERNVPILKSPQAGLPCSIAPPVCVEYPADWSLKTRLLFTSPLSFSWAEQPKAQEQALGLTQHCRAQYCSLPQSIQDPRSCSELRCAFQQCLQYWQHPSLPWLSLFPRINAERSFAGRSAPWGHDAALQQCLMNDWSVSLSSLYSLLKARLCPYFYLCSYQFTVLFRAAGLGGSSSVSAMLTPSTRGLREAMKADGIEFTLPLVEERRKSRQATKERGEEEEEEDDDGGFSWLAEMGVGDKIKKPDNISIQLHKERSSVCLDHKPESLVCVEGTHTFTLINFLMSCKSLVAATGSQAGLPPTLLAPTPFRGATLHSLKARSINVKTQVRAGYQDVCSLEVTGPVMPHALHAVARLLRPAQRGGFAGTLYTHEPTAVLNTHAAAAEEALFAAAPGSVDLSGCGLHPGTTQQLQQAPSLGKTALRQLHMSNYSYSWKS